MLKIDHVPLLAADYEDPHSPSHIFPSAGNVTSPTIPDDIELESIYSHENSSEAENESALVRRLDYRLLTFAMLGNMIKGLDSANLGNAFISGMEEELDIQNVQYNWFTVLFMIGTLLMQIPSNILLPRIRPSRYIPFLEIIWCILTLSMACTTSVTAVYVIRFLLGMAEAGFYPGIVFLLSTWYTKEELGKRNALFTIFGAMGTGISGILQAILLKTVDGLFGVSGWRWLFIVDGGLTLVMSVLAYKFMPDYPNNTRWLKENERRLAISRSTRNEIYSQKGPKDTLTVLKQLLTQWHFYLLILGWTCLQLSVGPLHVTGIVSKKLGFSAVAANLLTTPLGIVGISASVINGFLSDKLKTRLWCIVIPMSITLVGCCILVAFPSQFPILYLGFVFACVGLASAAPVAMTWASEIMSSNMRVRAMALAAMNTSAASMFTWAPLVLWKVTDAPYYKIGFRSTLAFTCVTIISFSLVGYVRKRQKARVWTNRDENWPSQYEPTEEELDESTVHTHMLQAQTR